MGEYSSSPTRTSAPAGQQSQRHSSEEETPMASTDVRFNVKPTASKEDTAGAAAEKDNPTRPLYTTNKKCNTME